MHTALPIDSWPLLTAILLEIATNIWILFFFLNSLWLPTRKIIFESPADIHKILHFHWFAVPLWSMEPELKLYVVAAATMNYMKSYFLCQKVQFDDKCTKDASWNRNHFITRIYFFWSFNVKCSTFSIPSEYLAIELMLHAYW